MLNIVSFYRKKSIPLLASLFLSISYAQTDSNSGVDMQQTIDGFLHGSMKGGARLGWAFAQGKYGAKQNCKKAGIILFFCAKQGEPECIKAIGDMYAQGICVKKDEKKAKYYYKIIKRNNQIIKGEQVHE